MLLSPEFFFQAELKFSLLKCSILWFLTQSLVLQPLLLASSRVFLLTPLKTFFVANGFVLGGLDLIHSIVQAGLECTR